MRTVSVELGEKLKNAGLVWEPKLYDQCSLYEKTHRVLNVEAIDDRPDAIFLPTLSDLLAELETRGWGWETQNTRVLNKDKSLKQTVYLFKAIKFIFPEIYFDDGLDEPDVIAEKFRADTPEEAAGLAVLWVLEKDKGEREWAVMVSRNCRIT